MGTDTTKWTVQNYLDSAPLVGLPASNFVPQSLRSQCATVANNSVPPSAPSTFPVVCQASLIIRGIFYFKSNPGDCGSPTQLNLTDANLTQISGAAAQSGVKIAASLAGAGSGIASMAGAVLPGIGVAVQAITTIFSNHAKAVATEQAVICSVSQVINQVIPHYDALVRSGQISPSTAYAGMQTFFNQVAAQLAQIEKTCDAACVYQGILKAHAAFVQMYYPQIAPASAASHAPGAAPSSITSPGGVVSVGNAPKPVAVSDPRYGSVGHQAETGDTLADYFGNSETLGTPFFSSAEGTSILPGVAGDYFSAATLANPQINPWGLNVNSVISDGQYTQIAANYGVTPVKATKPNTIYPLYGQQDNGMVSILYSGKLYPVNILTNSIITPNYQFQGGVLPVGYDWSRVIWYPNAAAAPYPVSSTPPSHDEMYLIAALVAIILVVFFVMRKGTA